MIRLAISPLMILLGMGLIAHFLAMTWVDWSACFVDAMNHSSTPYRDYLTNFLSSWDMAVPTLGIPFLPFILTALAIRQPVRLAWQWVGISITIGALAFALSSLGQPCPDEGDTAKYGIPELTPIIIGIVVAFPVCLVVTYIGSIRHARRKNS